MIRSSNFRRRSATGSIGPSATLCIRAFALLAITASCGEPAAPLNDGRIPTGEIRLSVDSMVLLERTSDQLSFTVLDSVGRRLTDRDVLLWAVNPIVATVSARGVVTARSLGTTQIVALVDGQSDTMQVTVRVRFRSIAAGGAHTCAVTVANNSYCWGKGSMGRLGTGFESNADVPALVAAPGPFTLLSPGGTSSCALAGSLAYCWGSNDARQLGTGEKTDTWEPLPVAGAHDFASVRLASSHACGLTTDGTALCWGADWGGQVGNGPKPRPFAPDTVVGARSFLAVATGWSFSCGLDAAGAAYCWGRNEANQLGSAAVDETCLGREGDVIPCTTDPLPVGTTERFVALDAAGLYACGLTAEGHVHCWGDNRFGQRGDGTTASSDEVSTVAGGLRFISIALGEQHACGLTPEGHAYCWGDNTEGALGAVGPTAACADGPCSPVPVRAAAPLSFASVSASRGLGGSHTCGMTGAGAAYCWGRNADGQLGNGDRGGSRAQPQAVWGQFERNE